MGGLAREASVVRGLRGGGAPVLLVNAGDVALAPDCGRRPLDLELARDKLRAVYAAYGRLGYDAAVPGETDLLLGIDLLKEEATRSKLRVLAANLELDGGPPFPATTRVSLAGLSILVVGVVDPALLAPELAAAGLRAGDPAAAAARALDEAGPADLVIAVAHLRPDLEGALLAAVPRIDVLVAGHDGRASPAFRAGDGGVAARPGPRGRALGRVDLVIPPGFEAGTRLENGAERKKAGVVWVQARQHLERMKAELGGRAPHEAFAGDPARSFRYADLAMKVSEAEEVLASFRGRALFAPGLVPLGPEQADDDEVAWIVAGWKARQLGRLRALAATSAAAGPAPGSGFAGPEACVDCHPAQVSSWRSSGHAHAYRSLAERGSEFDPTCLPCHSTGHRQAGGWEDPVLIGSLADVQCEACHGPSRAHAEREERSVRGGADPAVCLPCHTADRDPEFRYEERLEAIRHWGPGFSQASSPDRAAGESVAQPPPVDSH